MNKLWYQGTPNKSGHYIVTYRTVFTRGIHSKREITEDRVTPLYWDGERQKWDAGGDHGFAYPVLAWRRLPRPYRSPIVEQKNFARVGR